MSEGFKFGKGRHYFSIIKRTKVITDTNLDEILPDEPNNYAVDWKDQLDNTEEVSSQGDETEDTTFLTQNPLPEELDIDISFDNFLRGAKLIQGEINEVNKM